MFAPAGYSLASNQKVGSSNLSGRTNQNLTALRPGGDPPTYCAVSGVSHPEPASAGIIRMNAFIAWIWPP